MAFHMYVALHIEDFKDMIENLIKATIEHCCRCSATNVKGGHRLTANHLRIDINLFYNRFCVPFCYLRMINLLVVRAVRADLTAEGNMEIKTEFV